MNIKERKMKLNEYCDTILFPTLEALIVELQRKVEHDNCRPNLEIELCNCGKEDILEELKDSLEELRALLRRSNCYKKIRLEPLLIHSRNQLEELLNKGLVTVNFMPEALDIITEIKEQK